MGSQFALYAHLMEVASISADKSYFLPLENSFKAQGL